MSLVHEALRKAEREKQRKTGGVPSAPPSPHQAATPQPAHPPVSHAPAPTMPPAAPVPRHMDARPAAPALEKSLEANHFLLPALIGCVAIVAIIAIVFLVSNASSVLRQSKESAPVAAAATARPPVATSAVPAAEPQPTAPPRRDSASPPNVPPPAASAIDESKYKLSGIMKDPDGKNVAVLNSRVVYEGFFIDGATVEKIGPDRVTLDVAGQKVVRRLFCRQTLGLFHTSLRSLSLSPLRIAHRSLDFAVSGLALQRLAFVVLRLAFAQTDQDFRKTLGEINLQWEQRHALGVELAVEPVNFLLVKEKAARADRVDVVAVAKFVVLDVRVIEPTLAAFDASKGFFDGRVGGAKGFYFRAVEFDAGLVDVADKVIATGLVILNSRRHGRQYTTALPDGRVSLSSLGREALRCRSGFRSRFCLR